MGGALAKGGVFSSSLTPPGREKDSRMRTSHRGHKRHSILGCRALYGPFVRGLWLRWLRRRDTSGREGSYRPYVFFLFFFFSFFLFFSCLFSSCLFFFSFPTSKREDPKKRGEKRRILFQSRSTNQLWGAHMDPDVTTTLRPIFKWYKKKTRSGNKNNRTRDKANETSREQTRNKTHGLRNESVQPGEIDLNFILLSAFFIYC